jgi:hypothetical protein
LIVKRELDASKMIGKKVLAILEKARKERKQSISDCLIIVFKK